MKQVLSISDSFENTCYDFRSKTRTFKKYGVEPFICVPLYTSVDGSSLKNDISESIMFCFDSVQVDAIAIGLVRDPEDVRLIASVLESVQHNIVISEPGLIDDSGNVMVSAETYEEFSTRLLPQVQFISINLLETEVLSGMECHDRNDVLLAVKQIYDTFNCIIYVRGGNATENADLLFAGSIVRWFPPQQLPFSYSPDRSFLAAVACELVSEKGIIQAVASARKFYEGTEEENKEQLAKIRAAREEAEAYKKAKAEAAAAYVEPAAKPETPENVEPEQVYETEVAEATVVEEPQADENMDRMASLTKTPSLISPAKTLRDIAHSISYDDKAAEAPKSTVSDIKQKPAMPTLETPDIAGKARQAYSGKTGTASEIDAMKERLKRIAGM
ncbi:MAG: bifunctional hydroxymethylpyrimidine kinase/phosphomethylpyrimidine kinase [Clostridiales bacterium]|nr:bifunctional hydroxymethylpyrimidine kinase/phosphomethylpyrimidine kinase [Clostridiales bacterium]